MKTSKLFAAASALVLALGASACDSGLTEINENPNDPEVVPADNVFANGIASGVGRAFGANFNMTLTALWAQHMAKIQYIDEDRYDLRDQAVNAHWTGFYSVPLQDFQDVVNSGADNNRPNVEAQGLVMRSWLFQIMTDVWGDIPYSEALRGTGEARIVTPKYDTQEQVYNGILADLKRANDIIGAGAAINDGDLIYDGDMPSWKKFANSLRLRAAMRLSQVNPTLARTEAAAAIAAGVFTSNADNAVLNYTPSAPSQSPLYLNQIGFGGSRDDHGISATMVNTLKALNDPRLPVYAQPAPVDKQYRGAMNGPSDANAPVLNTISRLGTYFLRADWPAPLMTYAEVLFLRAEATQRGYVAGDAAALYRAGIRASMEMYDVPTASINAYIAQPSVTYNGLSSIAQQKWIALFMNGPEAYAEVRRLNSPTLTPASGSVIGARIPVRIFYPTNEESYNKANLEAAVARNGGQGIPEGLLTPVWWDK
ncbi:MAG TPA: SusD/RagB family nutrient-binding outer membrane lipoprotein [Longimicrobium sp.]